MQRCTACAAPGRAGMTCQPYSEHVPHRATSHHLSHHLTHMAGSKACCKLTAATQQAAWRLGPGSAAGGSPGWGRQTCSPARGGAPACSGQRRFELHVSHTPTHQPGSWRVCLATACVAEPTTYKLALCSPNWMADTVKHAAGWTPALAPLACKSHASCVPHD
jgi:hypothetical protein